MQMFRATQPSRKTGALVHALSVEALVLGGDVPMITVEASAGWGC